MFRNHPVLVISCVLGILPACATTQRDAREGVVAMKITETEAHVRMPNFAVRPGDHVLIVHRECRSTPKGLPNCHEEITGQGEVTQLLNVHDSVVALTPGSHYEEGDRVVLRAAPERAP